MNKRWQLIWMGPAAALSSLEPDTSREHPPPRGAPSTCATRAGPAGRPLRAGAYLPPDQLSTQDRANSSSSESERAHDQHRAW